MDGLDAFLRLVAASLGDSAAAYDHELNLLVERVAFLPPKQRRAELQSVLSAAVAFAAYGCAVPAADHGLMPLDVMHEFQAHIAA